MLTRLTFVILLTLTLGTAALADETIELAVTRRRAFVGALTMMEVYVNGVSIGSFANGDARVITFDKAKLGKNEVRLAQQTVLGTYPVYTDAIRKTGDRKYFALRQRAAKVVITFGGDDNNISHTFFQVSDEVPEDWDQPKTTKVVLDAEMKSKIIKKSPPISLARGTDKTVEDTMTIKHQVMFAKHWRLDADLKAKILLGWAYFDAQVKAEIEQTTNKQYSSETTRTRSVRLTGAGAASRVRVVWLEYYRSGVATVRICDRTTTVPFEFPDDFDLTTEEVQ